MSQSRKESVPIRQAASTDLALGARISLATCEIRHPPRLRPTMGRTSRLRFRRLSDVIEASVLFAAVCVVVAVQVLF